MAVRSGWLSPDSQSREDTRLVSLGALTPTSPVATRSGILPGSPDGQFRITGFTLTGTASSMSASVSPGRAVVQSTDARGAYPVALTEYLNVTFADGDALYGRIDLLVLRIYDDLYDGSGRSEAVVEIVKGTPAATPAIPATPDLAIPLYQIAVPKNTSAGTGGIAWATALTGVRNATVGLGGILPVTTDTANGAYPGQYRDSSGQLQRWNGTAWADYPVLPTWQSWTPAWTTSTGSATPAFGNASVSGRYVKFGTTVHLNFQITFGSTTNFGTSPTTNDSWRFSLPVAAASTRLSIGFAEMAAGTAGNRAAARLYLSTTGAFELITSSGQPTATTFTYVGGVDSLTPWTWANGHTVTGSATYEAAV
ncbi:hypothetical protein OG601_13460 [Streptomyces sp. NBC_01239]|uniref:hypothetical protein n=1 Tax=Streptomyces sp. NBC_01239 TaxID=2903792 RepID=UPI0022550120|nr:hypothetical protein [Streptomyces sp. NBC_01239]MCX4811621.1 hypothetical protein [Streptomyces sp. NBC_01239]